MTVCIGACMFMCMYTFHRIYVYRSVDLGDTLLFMSYASFHLHRKLKLSLLVHHLSMCLIGFLNPKQIYIFTNT